MSLEAVPFESAALLVVDMQNAFCHPEGTLGISGVDVAPAQATIAPVRRLVEAFRASGTPVVWTRQVHLDPDRSRARKVLAAHTQRRSRVAALAGTWDADIVDDLADLADDPTFVVTKHRFGAFYETRMASLLAMLGTRTLFLAGTTANACIETTLREAYLRDFDVVAVTDAIASVRPEWNATTHAVWEQYLAVLSSCAEVHAWLGEARQPGALHLHHVLLETEDLARAEHFYLDVLGLELRDRQSFRDGRDLTLLEGGLGLTEQRKKGIDHICLRARDVDGLTRRAVEAGCHVLRGPGDGPYGYTVYIEDPDGNEVELFEPSRPT